MRGERLPAVDDLRQIIAMQNVQQHMHMIRHDAPSVKLVSHAVEMRDGAGNDSRVSSKQAAAVRQIEFPVESCCESRVEASTLDEVAASEQP